MQLKNPGLRTKLCFTAALILIVGLGIAAPVYLTAERNPDNAMVHNYENSKSYIHGLELYGGKMNVMTDQFCRWFQGLWHGESLAFTIAFLSILISLGFFFVAFNLPAGPEQESRGGPDASGGA